MEKERLDNATQSQLQVRSKLSELQLKFDSRLKEAELLISETKGDRNRKAAPEGCVSP